MSDRTRDKKIPAWKRRRLERLGLPVPEERREASEERREPSQAVAEHSASLSALHALRKREEQADG